MNCFRNVVIVFFVAFVSLHTAVDATDYIIPEACLTDQLFDLDGDTMNGSTFIFNNTRKVNVTFQLLLPKYNNWNATVSFYTDSRTTVCNKSFNENVEGMSMNFSLTGTWLPGDRGSVYYDSGDLRPEDCYDRTATNLLVRGVYEITKTVGGRRTINARAGCGVKATLQGIYPLVQDPCNITLKFGDGKTFNESSINETITSVGSSIYFDVYSDCDQAEAVLFYQEDCRSTTAATSESTVSRSPSESMDQSTVSTPQTTKSSEDTVSMSSTVGTSQSIPLTSSIVTATEPMISTTPATATSESTVSRSPSSGMHLVAHALSATFALILSMVQWL